jgi:hypothetical protein
MVYQLIASQVTGEVTVTVEYASFYLHAVQDMKKAHDALVEGKHEEAYEHCLNAQVEMRLMAGAVKTWINRRE